MKKKLTMFILIVAGVAGMFVVYTNLTIERVGVEVGNAAVDFTLPTWTEEERSLSSYSGDIVIMNMWASWCEPCTREIPDLLQLHEDYHAEGVSVLTINMNSYERTREDAQRFVEEYNMTEAPAVIDVEGDVADMYNIQYLPTTYIIDEDGIIVDKIPGEVSYELLEQKVLELL
ncbi:TlpA family protein disulfide reductase [Bacillus sp. FJAT-44742]|uniref:TlpA family protein disulfide reductase n=1 Tax=Bacillus sp. FJAT-44742 TaxID=2014005 RepID=UPI0012FEE9A4|nr:TlpA disulfide reductase family protein [Bacillus sp. FJAT-44742]